MNNKRRKELEKAIHLLESADQLLKLAAEIIEFERDAEQEAYDNMPESLQAGERGEAAQAAASALDEVCDALAEFEIETLTNGLREAMNGA